MTSLIRILVVTNALLILSMVILGAWLYSALPEQHSWAASEDTGEAADPLPPSPQAGLERAAAGQPGRLPGAREIEAIVRSTVRSELRRLNETSGREASETRPMQRTANAAPGVQNDPQRIEEQRIQHRIVAEELDHFIAQGRISNVEMSALQVEIGKLPPEGRIVAMRRLVAALNSGELEGQL